MPDAADCLFCGIADKTVPAKVVQETDELVAFHDVRPQAPTHLIVIPKRHISRLSDVTEPDAALIGRLIVAANALARGQGIAESGYRLVLNCNAHGGQTVFHLHLHVLGGRPMRWPPG